MTATEMDQHGNELYLAGDPAPSGRYKELDGRRVVVLESDDVLPAALDGHATCYMRIQHWRDRQAIDSEV
jgi:hypothetical protein